MTEIMQNPPLTTIEEAKKHLDKNMHLGANCPCCNQTVKRYSRKITTNMAYALFLFNKFTQGNTNEFIHFENCLKAAYIPSGDCTDFPKLRFWGLIEGKRDTKKDDGNPRNGYYRITEKGMLFLKGEESVHERVNIFNNQFYGHEGNFVTFKECLGSKFNYDELMGSV